MVSLKNSVVYCVMNSLKHKSIRFYALDPLVTSHQGRGNLELIDLGKPSKKKKKM